MRREPKEAFEYRFRCLGEPIPAEYTSTISVDDMKAKLIEAGVKFSHLAGEKKIKELFDNLV